MGVKAWIKRTYTLVTQVNLKDLTLQIYFCYAPNFEEVEQMPPTSKKLRGYIGLGLSIGLTVRLLRLHTIKNG